MNKRLKRVFLSAGRPILYVFTGLISLFILASGYESVYGRPLPLVHTLQAVNLSALAQTYDLKAAAILKPSIYGQFGKPATITLPGTQSSLRLSIVAPIEYNKEWLARASTMHMLIPAKPQDGNISTEILYCRSSFRTISADSLPSTGSNLFVDTDQNWRYVYKVTLAKVYAVSYPYVPQNDSAKGKLIVFCSDPASHANVIVESDLISVQAVTQ